MKRTRKKYQMISLLFGTLLLNILIFMLVTKASTAPTVYLGGIGASDNNLGTIDSPVATIEKAYALLDSDDDITAEGGIIVFCTDIEIGEFFFPASEQKITFQGLNTDTTIFVTGQSPEWFFCTETEFVGITIDFVGSGNFEINTGKSLIFGEDVNILHNGALVTTGDESIGIRMGGQTAKFSEGMALEGIGASQTSVVTGPIDYSNSYENFVSEAIPFCLTPGLNENYIPQGIAYSADNLLYLSAYAKNGTDSSCIFVLNTEGDLCAEYILKNVDGSAFTGHVGGIAVTEDTLILRGAGENIIVWSLEGLPISGSHDLITSDSISLPLGAAYLSYEDGILWAGNFYYKNSAEYNPERIIDENYCTYILGYVLGENGIDCLREVNGVMATPDYLLVNTSKYLAVQGMVRLTNGEVVLSSSNGSANSALRSYAINLNSPEGTINIDRRADTSVGVANYTAVNYYEMDSSNIQWSISAMPRSEGLALDKDGNLLVLFESGASKYINTSKGYPTDYIWKYNLVSETEGNSAAFTMKSGRVSYISAGNRYSTEGHVVIRLGEDADVSNYIDASGLQKGGWGACTTDIQLTDGVEISLLDLQLEENSSLAVDAGASLIIDDCLYLLPEYTGDGTVLLGHELIHIERVEATSNGEGNIEYWYCSDETCSNAGKYYTDSLGSETVEDVIIPPINDLRGEIEAWLSIVRYQSDYSATSWEEYQNVNVEIRAEAQGLIENEATTDEELQTMLNRLNTLLVIGNPDIKQEGDFRVGTFNICSDPTANPNLPNVSAISEQLLRCEVDYVGIQEVDMLTGRDNRDVLGLIAGDDYYDYFSEAGVHSTGGYYGIGILSKSIIDGDVEQGLFTKYSTNEEQRNWQRIVVDVNGKQVAIYNIQLTQADTAALYYMRQLMEIMDSDTVEYKVLIGDFELNAQKLVSDSYINLPKKGYSLVHGQNGLYYTTKDASRDGVNDAGVSEEGSYTGELTTNHACSQNNIIVSSNIEIVQSRLVYNDGLSDHYLLYADLRLLGYDEELVELVNSLNFEENEYTDDSWAVYSMALESANVILANENIVSMQNECRIAVEDLNAAIAALERNVVTSGFTAGITSQDSWSSVGEKVEVNISVNHTSKTEYTAAEIAINYDTAKLTFNASDSVLGTALVQESNGVLTISDFGAGKIFGSEAYTLVFDVIADGIASVNLISAIFTDETEPSTANMDVANLSPSALNMTICKKEYGVSMSEIFVGLKFAVEGEDYTFSKANDDNQYTYSDVTARVGGTEVTVIHNSDGSYTIENVTGTVIITGKCTANE